MTGIQLYDVDAAYIHELYQHDKEIRMSKESLRPYLFTTIEINNKPYLIPLSSPKSNKRRSEEITDFIYDNEQIIGVIEYHKLIPFHEKIARPINIDTITDKRYRRLLLKDYIYLDRHLGFEKITRKATIIYNARYNPNHYLYRRYLSKFGTDIKKLETVMHQYVRELKQQQAAPSIASLRGKQTKLDAAVHPNNQLNKRL